MDIMKHRLLLTLSLAASVKELQRAPAGPAYSAFMMKFPDMTSEEFWLIARSLEHAKALRISGNILIWLDNAEWNDICDRADDIAKVHASS